MFPIMNTLNIELLKIFYFVAKTGSLTKASKLLGHPKSKLSKDLSKLEDALEHKVLNRSPRGVTMTEKGLILYKNCKDPIKLLLNCPDSLEVKSDELKGQIKITAPEDINQMYLLDLANDFQQMHPKVRIEIYSTTEILSFQNTDIDFALRIGKLDDSSLIQKKIGDIEVKYFASREYLKSHPTINKISDLSEHKVASIKKIEGALASKLPYDSSAISFSSNSILLLKQLSLKSNAIVTLPTFYCEREVRESKLCQVLEDETFFKAPLYLLSRPNKFTANHSKIFKKLILERLSNHIM